MSSHLALVATEPVRAPAERARRNDVADRAGQLEVVRQTAPVTSTITPTPTPAETEAPELDEAVETVRNVVADLQRQLQFSVDEDSGRTIITVIDRESGKIIRQIPPEELLQIADMVASGGKFNLIDSQA